MMQFEFESLIRHEISCEEYEKVETVYMAWNFKEMSKQRIADLYKYDREFVIYTLYSYIKQYNKHEFNKLKSENEALQLTIEEQREKIELLRSMLLKYMRDSYTADARIEELETQLHQYKALFTDMEEKMTVNLYETLLGVAR